ncbi:chromosome partitioning protein ParB [bacterium M00.F.Ca.ET.228.01.1.1]|uniref:ParB/Srx family N-terminal domain-containing protein n=1 Tax=Paraburkholderia phenoliruptrix TaxID=252970 RepID=UPI001092B5A8|nr:ParB/Srx family N-terminal domain-containing protein [Paraburkholderia phenoliruptrix]TGP45981.1 chromosome partitioning protein ParB [bacterium M00.F.Ca.ET.228.01.1.1]TGS04106.1 chromosome partitioning protein ParB [bacterium M00.F.Ca.ET.191.01.1.1]TGU07274.1 chromosome partitioning protein ParB [bacterium M00.F.Ca.ET.155.01.1.1]MBW0446512.1 ParB/Srx family N-terminal domain-containing protein [Paraburkholderia phenoliruptrix]MBW9097061.1 ParB/Srx family N-terminal domain-containing protei
MKMLEIERLRPTQVTHGMREVREKTHAYQSLSGHDLEMAIAEKPIPVVLGPGGEAFATDHHHVAAALWHVDIKSVPFVLVRDLSTCSHAEFWLALENNCWTFPYDQHGQRVPFTDMPRHVWDMIDDEFRSLAAAVRDAGGYRKTNVPLAEFRWADLFRKMLPPASNDAEYKALVGRAMELAKSEAALGLPGYVGSEGN